MEYSNFPWAYPELFTNILLMTDYKTILNSRLTCKSFRDWFNKNKIWIKYLKQRRNVFDEQESFENSNLRLNHKSYITQYRLNRLLKGSSNNKLTEKEAFTISCKMNNILRQQKLDLVPNIPKTTFKFTKRLEKEVDEEDGILSFGPISAFIRIKVKSPLVTSIVLELVNTVNRFLTCIVVDRYQKDNNPAVQNISYDAFRSREVQFLYTYFNQQQDPSLIKAKSIWKERFDNQRALTIKEFKKTQATSKDPIIKDCKCKNLDDIDHHYKRALEEGLNAFDEEPDSKRAKIATEDDKDYEEPSIYEEKPSAINPNFPTILELLDFDNPVMKQVLIERCQIDKTLVIPSLDQIFLQQSNLIDIIPEDFGAVGRDFDGIISKIQPYTDVRETDESRVIHLENIEPAHGNQTEKIMFWGGKDISDRWSGFAEQLSQEETHPMEIKKSLINQLVLMAPYIPVPDIDIPENLNELQAMLEARGTIIQRN